MRTNTRDSNHQTQEKEREEQIENLLISGYVDGKLREYHERMEC